jgi:hypothetical protein
VLKFGELQVLEMMGLVKAADAIVMGGESVMPTLEAIQYNTHPIDQESIYFGSGRKEIRKGVGRALCA